MSYNIYNLRDEPIAAEEIYASLVSEQEFQVSIDKAIHKAQSTGLAQLLTLSLPFERIDPLAALEILGKSDDAQFYWEHPDENLAVAAGKEAIRIRSNHRDRFQLIRKQIESWQSRTESFSAITHSLCGLHFLGGFSFQEHPQHHHWKSLGNACFFVPEWLIVRDGELSLLTVTKIVDSSASAELLESDIRETVIDIIDKVRSVSLGANGVKNGHSSHVPKYKSDTRSNIKSNWIAAVEEAKGRILVGEFDKIVLAREFRLRLKSQPRVTQMLNYLREAYPTCYTFMMRLSEESAFIGSTPEKLVSLRASLILTDGLAGTISRGKTATEDSILERKLLSSEKDLSEHGFVVDAIGERLRSITTAMNYPSKPGIRKFGNVQHLYTPITASLQENTSPLEVIEQLHPTPAVGGHPREKTIQHIQSLEKFDRGWYAGPLGWLNSNGRGEFCVAIRSGIIMEGQARFFAGCGIVADSDPESEWEETRLKLIPMLSALKHA